MDHRFTLVFIFFQPLQQLRRIGMGRKTGSLAKQVSGHSRIDLPKLPEQVPGLSPADLQVGIIGAGTGATGGSPSNDDETVHLIFVNRNDAFANLFDARLGVTPVEKGTRRAIILNETATGGALSKVPAPGDQFLGVGETVTVTDAQTIRAGGSTIAYVMDVSD